MLELETNNSRRCKFVVFLVEHGVRCRHQCVVFVSSIEGNCVDEAVKLDKVLLDGSSVPNLVDRFPVSLTELVSKRLEKILSFGVYVSQQMISLTANYQKAVQKQPNL